jgi:hypothetical protein
VSSRPAILPRVYLEPLQNSFFDAAALARIGLVESALCECERGEETIGHVILSCTRWTEERRELRIVAKERAGDVPFLSGGWGKKKDSKGQLVDGPKEKWRPDLEVVKAAI